uniref:B30.2/SPRY domain-containing protein n=1 Tax=Myripristis murdjan TaxID=586833 RepID=A0A668AJM5_9TELE
MFYHESVKLGVELLINQYLINTKGLSDNQQLYCVLFSPSDSCEVSLDRHTAHRKLLLSEDNRKVTVVTGEQPYPDHPNRFDHWTQLLCCNGLTGRCYWEVEWKGQVSIAVTCGGIRRERVGDDSRLGDNDKSWRLDCTDHSYCVCHNKTPAAIHAPSSSRVGVYLDWPAGSLSFYRISSDTLIHLHTFTSTFTQPLYPAFGLDFGSSVSLCPMEHTLKHRI